MITAILLINALITAMLTFGLVRQSKIYALKRDTYDALLNINKLLVVIKEWAELGKRAHEASLAQQDRTAARAERIQEATHQIKEEIIKVPDAVVEKMGGPTSGVSQNPWPPAAGG